MDLGERANKISACLVEPRQLSRLALDEIRRQAAEGLWRGMEGTFDDKGVDCVVYGRVTSTASDLKVVDPLFHGRMSKHFVAN
jgi:hypothetical protein